MTKAENPDSSKEAKSEECGCIEDHCMEQSEQELQENELNAENQEPLDEVSKLNAEVQKLKSEVASMHDKYLRSLADFDNFKKRAQKERSDLLKYQGEQLIVDLLGIIDDLDLAMQFNDGAYKDSDPEKFRQGVGLIYKNLCDVLKKWDIRPDSSLGKEFDPKKNMAISRVFNQEQAPGTVVSELKKAFFYKDKIIRVGEVVVAAENSDPKKENT